MSEQVDLFTIGFTQKKAEQFFETLIKSGVKRVIDTRLNNVSQLAGFAKKPDLAYFLQKIGGIEYIHILDLAPTKDILDAYKKKEITWDSYEQKFNQLIKQRKIEKAFSSLPDEIKAIKEKALSEVFKKDLAELDEPTRELIEKMLTYMEKKCVGVPMKAAREIIL